LSNYDTHSYKIVTKVINLLLVFAIVIYRDFEGMQNILKNLCMKKDIYFFLIYFLTNQKILSRKVKLSSLKEKRTNFKYKRLIYNMC
jgi:hypothetical protein